jgi:hypothetical protein
LANRQLSVREGNASPGLLSPLAAWQHPGLQALADWARVVESQWMQGHALPVVLNAVWGTTRFVAHDALPQHEPYERFIGQHQQVPTRPNAHDALNAWCWMHWPRLKQHFNALQCEAIARDGIHSRRGPVRDAITVFDENGLFLQAPDAIWQAVVDHDWHRAFVAHRADWSRCRLAVVGHALLENLIQPFKGITAHVLRWPEAWGDDLQHLDEQATLGLTPAVLASKPFHPLPVMGIPGWMPQQDAAFYDDPQVFRPKRVKLR